MLKKISYTLLGCIALYLANTTEQKCVWGAEQVQGNEPLIEEEQFLAEVEYPIWLLDQCMQEIYGAVLDETQNYMNVYEDEASCCMGKPKIGKLVTWDEEQLNATPELIYPATYKKVLNYTDVQDIYAQLERYISKQILEIYQLENDFAEYEGELYHIYGNRGYGASRINLDSTEFTGVQNGVHYVNVDVEHFGHYDHTGELGFETIQDRWVLTHLRLHDVVVPREAYRGTQKNYSFEELSTIESAHQEMTQQLEATLNQEQQTVVWDTIVDGEWLYYGGIGNEGDDWGLFKCRVDGTENTFIAPLNIGPNDGVYLEDQGDTILVVIKTLNQPVMNIKEKEYFSRQYYVDKVTGKILKEVGSVRVPSEAVESIDKGTFQCNNYYKLDHFIQNENMQTSVAEDGKQILETHNGAYIIELDRELKDMYVRGAQYGYDVMPTEDGVYISYQALLTALFREGMQNDNRDKWWDARSQQPLETFYQTHGYHPMGLLYNKPGKPLIASGRNLTNALLDEWLPYVTEYVSDGERAWYTFESEGANGEFMCHIDAAGNYTSAQWVTLELTSPDYYTDRFIHVGDTKAFVAQCYGVSADYEADVWHTVIDANAECRGISFYFEGDQVRKIVYNR